MPIKNSISIKFNLSLSKDMVGKNYIFFIMHKTKERKFKNGK